MRYKRLMLFGDAFFTYSLESLKYITGFTLAYEVNLKFADPQQFSSVVLFITALTCIVVLWITDSYAGKYYIALFGAFMIALSLLCSFIYFWDVTTDRNVIKLTATIMLMFYITTSNARNHIILDQTALPRQVKKVRKFLFLVVYIKILARILFVFSFQICALATPFLITFLQIHLTAALLFVVCYIAMLILLGNRLYYDALYFQIWEHCVKCYVSANIARNKLPSNAKLSSVDSGNLVVQGILKTPEATHPTSKRKVGFAMTSTDKETSPAKRPKIKSRIRKHEDKEPTSVVRHWGFRGIFEQSLRSPSIIVNRDIPSSSDQLNISNPNLEEDKREVQNIISDNDAIKDKHWLNWSYPKCSEYVIHQTMRLLGILYFLLPGIVFGLLMYMISTVTIIQANMARRPYPNQGLEYFEITTYALILELIFLPFFELLLFPSLKSKFYRDLHFTLVGFALLIIAAVIMFALHVYAELTLGYMPKPFKAQVRIFNALNTKSFINTPEEGMHRIGPYAHHFIKNIYVGGRPRYWFLNVKNVERNVSKSKRILVYQKRTITFVLHRGGITRATKIDPTIFMKSPNRDDAMGHFFVVSQYRKIAGTVEFINMKTNSSFKEFKFIRSKMMNIPSGQYQMIFQDALNLTYNFSYTANVRAGALYALFLYSTGRRLEGEMVLAEGPFPYTYEHLLWQLIFMYLAQAFATVSYFRFLYLESPAKLRCSLFNIILTFNLIGVAMLNTRVFGASWMTDTFLLLAVIVFSTIVFGFTFLFARKFSYRYEGH